MDAAIDRQGLSLMYSYNAYATGLVLDTVSQLTDEQLDDVIPPNYTSIRKLLLHSFLVEGFFLAQCQQRPFGWDKPATIEELRRAWREQHEATVSYLASASDEDLRQVLSVEMREQPFQFPAWQLLMQAVIHSLHHRGELAIMLGTLGHPLPDLDIIIHFWEQAGQSWPWK